MLDDEAKARAAGCNGFLRKPIRMAELINGLNDILEISPEREAQLSELITARSETAASAEPERVLEATAGTVRESGRELVTDENSLPTLAINRIIGQKQPDFQV